MGLRGSIGGLPGGPRGSRRHPDNTWDTKYVTVSNTWAIKDTVKSYCTKYTLRIGINQFQGSDITTMTKGLRTLGVC